MFTLSVTPEQFPETVMTIAGPAKGSWWAVTYDWCWPGPYEIWEFRT